MLNILTNNFFYFLNLFKFFIYYYYIKMENIRYHEIKAQNDKPTFQADDLVDFEMDANGRSIVRNSIEICGKVQVYKTSISGGRVVRGDAGKLYMNKNAGAHSFIENISCSTLNQGNIESIGFAYPRWVNMVTALEKQNQNLNNVSTLCEWVVPDKELSDNFLRETKVDNGSGATYTEDFTFSMKPMIVLNRTNGDIPFQKTGKVRISMNLAQNEKALENHLTGVNNLVYTITDMRLRFRSVPSSSEPQAIVAQKFTPLKTSINSTTASMSFNVPSKASNGVSISFQKQSNEGNPAKDNLELEKLNVESVQYFFNSANTYLNYKLDNTSEIVMRGLKSISPNNDEGTYQITQQDLASNSAFIIGTDFDGVIDLSQNSFEVELISNIDSATNVYLVFHSIVSM